MDNLYRCILYNMHIKFSDSDTSNCAISESSHMTKCIYHKKNKEQNCNGHNNNHHKSKHNKYIDDPKENEKNIPKEKEKNIPREKEKKNTKKTSKSSDISELSISSSLSISASSSSLEKHKKHIYKNNIICEYDDMEENKFKHKREMYEILGIKRKIFILYKLMKMLKKSIEVINIIKYKATLGNVVLIELIKSIRLFMYEFIRKIKFGLAYVFNAIIFTSLSTTKEKIQIGCNSFLVGIEVFSSIETVNLLSLCDESLNNHILLLRFLKRHILLLNLKYNTIYKNRLLE